MKIMFFTFLLSLAVSSSAFGLECTGEWPHKYGHDDFVFTDSPKKPYSRWIRGSKDQVSCPSYQLMNPKAEYYMILRPNYTDHGKDCTYVPGGIFFSVNEFSRHETETTLKMELFECYESGRVQDNPAPYPVTCYKKPGRVIEIDKKSLKGTFYNILEDGKLYPTAKLTCVL